jgi:hypothetical protein
MTRFGAAVVSGPLENQLFFSKNMTDMPHSVAKLGGTPSNFNNSTMPHDAHDARVHELSWNYT